MIRKCELMPIAAALVDSAVAELSPPAPIAPPEGAVWQDVKTGRWCGEGYEMVGPREGVRFCKEPLITLVHGELVAEFSCEFTSYRLGETAQWLKERRVRIPLGVRVLPVWHGNSRCFGVVGYDYHSGDPAASYDSLWGVEAEVRAKRAELIAMLQD